MPLTVATWNVNSSRLRAPLIERFLKAERPDVLCLQECKAPPEKMGLAAMKPLGYRHIVARGEKGYNGVAILSKRPLTDVGDIDFGGTGQARHCAARTDDGVTIHNLYVPAGGDTPDPEENPKFAAKLAYVAALRDHFGDRPPERSILVGDLNIAPGEDDVWSHKQLLKVVSHTPVEVEHLTAAQAAGGWVDVVRGHHPEGKLYSWWSYRNPNWQTNDKGRRLDHIWASPDIAPQATATRLLRDARTWERPSDHIPVATDFDL